MPVGQIEISKPRHRDIEIDDVDISSEHAGILPPYEKGADRLQQRRIERLDRRRLLEMPGKMNVLDAHQANERRRADKMVEGVGNEPAHPFERRKLLQREIVLVLAHLPIDAFEDIEVEPLLAAEIVIDQVLARPDALG